VSDYASAARKMQRWLRGLLFGAGIGVVSAVVGATPVGLALEENVGLPWLFRLRGPIPPPPEVAVVALDERSAIELGVPERPREWPRSLHGRLIDTLVDRGADVIAFDLTFERAQPKEEDAAFARAMARSERVLLVESVERKCPQADDAAAASVCFEEVRRPVPLLAEAAWGLAPFPLPRTPSSSVNAFWAFLGSSEDRPTLPALAVQGRALRHDEAWRRVFYDASAGIIGRAGGIEEATRQMRSRAKAAGSTSPLLPTGEIGAVAPFAVSRQQPALREAIERLYAGPDSHFLNFYGPAGTIRHISYSRLIGSGSPSHAADADTGLEGVAVFVGSSELGKPVQADHFRTVYPRDDGVEMSGAEVAATAYANLLTSATLQPVGPMTALGVMAALGVILTACAYGLPLAAAAPSTVALALGYGIVAVALFARHVWLPFAIPLLLTLPAALIVGTGGQLLLAWRQRRRAEGAEKAAIAASAAKSAFLATMSHEIRTLLSWVTGLVERLDRADLDDIERGLVARVRQFSETLLRLLNDVLDVAKMEAGALQLAPEAVTLRPLLQAVVDMHRPAADAKGLDVSLQIADTVPPVVVTDPLRLCQILWNLMGNAVKFTERGHVVARLDTEGEVGERARLRLSVSDTGIGIPEETQAALFQPFRQADATTARRFGGSGLGLSIARQLTETMGGTIALESRPGEGSTFTVRLLVAVVSTAGEPLAAVHLFPGLADHAPPGLGAGAMREAFPGGGLPCADGDVLVAEDDSLNRLLIEGQLNTLGFTPRLCRNGDEAWTSLQQRPARLLITDHHMPPGCGGVELTRRIRGDGPLAGVRIIGLTADAQPDAVKACLDAGMDLVLIKPLRLPDLPDALQRLGIPFETPGPAGADPWDAGAGDTEAGEVGAGESAAGEAGAADPSEGAAAAIFDPGNLVQAFGGIDEQARRLLAEFLVRTTAAVAEAKSLVASRNAEALRQLTHRLAGSSASMGALSLGRLFNDIAAAAAASDWRRIDALTARLDQSLADVAKVVASYGGDPG